MGTSACVHLLILTLVYPADSQPASQSPNLILDLDGDVGVSEDEIRLTLTGNPYNFFRLEGQQLIQVRPIDRDRKRESEGERRRGHASMTHSARISMAAFLSCIFLAYLPIAFSAQPYNINLAPRQELSAEESGFVFYGNKSSSDHFKLLEQDGNSILVGARNAVYNLSLPDLRQQQKLIWESPESARLDCQHKGESAEVCQNYIRVLVKERGGRSLVCGTNAFHPLCRLYAPSPEGGYQVEREFEGTGLCPYDPRHNSTATFLPVSGEIYAGTVTDRAGTDPLIYRRSIDSLKADQHQLRTQRNDLNTLNSPDFVSSFADSGFVYFWFRELGVESVNNGELEVLARVARVCQKDLGGPSSHESWAGGWTSFLKARLNCSLPSGTASFYFNRLEATSPVVTGKNGERLVYAVLTTPASAIQMSAVCAFDMAQVEAIFDVGQFLAQEVPQESLWLPVPQDRVPKPRPGRCSPHSPSLSHDFVNFIHKNSLMAPSIPNHFRWPLLVDNSMGARLTQIAVHPSVVSVNGQRYDVLFVGTSDGRLMKVVRVEGARSVVVESVVLRDASPIRNLDVYRPNNGHTGRLVVVTNTALRSFPLHNCARQKSCSACLHLQDPYCAWDLNAGRCVGNSNGFSSFILILFFPISLNDNCRLWERGEYVQNVESGRSKHCPEGVVDPEFYAVNQPASVSSGGGLYSAASMSIAVVATLALALTLGFLVGLRFQSWRRRLGEGSRGGSSSTSSASDYDSHALGLSRLTRHDAAAKAAKLDALYAEKPYGLSPSEMGRPLGGRPGGRSLVEEVLGARELSRAASLREGGALLPPSGGTLGRPSALLTTSAHPALAPGGYRTALSQSLHAGNGTLPRDYRVKKVYV